MYQEVLTHGRGQNCYNGTGSRGEGDEAILVFRYILGAETRVSTSIAWSMTLGWTFILLLAIY
jgi:hypothetical protein